MFTRKWNHWISCKLGVNDELMHDLGSRKDHVQPMMQSSHLWKQKTAWCGNKLPICHYSPRRFFGSRTYYIVLKVHNCEDERCFERKFCNVCRLHSAWLRCALVSPVLSASRRDCQNFQFVWQLQALVTSASHPVWDSLHETSLTPYLPLHSAFCCSQEAFDFVQSSIFSCLRPNIFFPYFFIIIY